MFPTLGPAAVLCMCIERADGYRDVHDPRALAVILEKAEEDLAKRKHPDPYIRESHFSIAP